MTLRSIDKYSNDGVPCPYCGHVEKPEDQDGYSMYDENQSEWQCVDCGKEFELTVHCSYSWSSEPIEDEDEAA